MQKRKLATWARSGTTGFIQVTDTISRSKGCNSPSDWSNLLICSVQMHGSLTAGGLFYMYMLIVLLNITVAIHLKLIFQALYTGSLGFYKLLYCVGKKKTGKFSV